MYSLILSEGNITVFFSRVTYVRGDPENEAKFDSFFEWICSNSCRVRPKRKCSNHSRVERRGASRGSYSRGLAPELNGSALSGAALVSGADLQSPPWWGRLVRHLRTAVRAEPSGRKGPVALQPSLRGGGRGGGSQPFRRRLQGFKYSLLDELSDYTQHYSVSSLQSLRRYSLFFPKDDNLD